MLEVLVNAPEPHDKHLLDKIADGLKTTDRFKHTCVLFYAVRQNPPPMWLRKLPRHSVLKELLSMLLQSYDVTVMVAGMMVLVVILPILPYEMAHSHLGTILEIFWSMMRWTPKQDQDFNLKPYMQIAVYSLFHRLYALYPCNLLNFMRNNTLEQNKLYFMTTLKPMLEHVRLHPLLVSENKATEMSRNRWVGMEPHQLLHECAKLCLDPLESTCEEMPWSWLPSSNRSDNTKDETPEPTSLILCQSDNNFWSPGVIQSPATRTTSSIPHTPVYGMRTPSQISNNSLLSTQISDSPPEAAIEATPETTPYTSPMKLENRRRNTAVKNLKLVTPESNNYVKESSASPMSPRKKETLTLFPETKKVDIFSKVEKSSILKNKLKEIHFERQQSIQDSQEALKQENISDVDQSTDYLLNGGNQTSENVLKNREINSNQNTTKSDPRSRRRKISVYNNENLKIVPPEDKENELSFAENSEQNLDHLCPNENIINRRISEEKETSSDESRKESVISSDDQKEGIGVPTPHTMQDFLKNIRTNRLRFLSQCAAPPDLSLIVGNNSIGVQSPTKHEQNESNALQKSISCPNLNSLEETISTLSNVRRKKYSSTTFSFALSPTRPNLPIIEKCDSFTQTEETTVINPYEQLLEALLPPSKPKPDSENHADAYSEILSPHQLLNNYIKQVINCSQGTSSELVISRNYVYTPNNKELINQLDAMHTLLLLERHKREVHAERNRRLLSKAKSLYVLKEKENEYKKEIHTMSDQVSNLMNDLHKIQVKNDDQQQLLQLAKREHNDVILKMKEEQNNLKQQQKMLKEKNIELLKENREIRKKLQETESSHLWTKTQLKEQSRLTDENNHLKRQVENLQKQCILIGEVQDECQLQLWQLKTSSDIITTEDLDRERFSAFKEIESLKEENRVQTCGMKALAYRVKELEKQLSEKEKEVNMKNYAIQTACEIGSEQCKIVERRCKSLSNSNITLESQLLEMHNKVDTLTRQLRRSQRGRPGYSETFSENGTDLSSSTSPSVVNCDIISNRNSSSFITQNQTTQLTTLGLSNILDKPKAGLKHRKQT